MKAFPLYFKHPTTGAIVENQGMELRDWFAGLAIQGLAMELIAFQGLGVKKAVEFAYEIADAMMKQRENKDE